jgi:hypothetical protein
MAIPKLVNLAQMTTPTVGTGQITMGVAAASYRTFAAAGIVNGDTVSYSIFDLGQREYGTGVITVVGSVMTMTRNLRGSTTGSLLSLSGGAIVSLTPAAEDFPNLSQRVLTTTPYSAQTTDKNIFIALIANAACTITLPLASLMGNSIFIKDALGIALTYNHIIRTSGSDVFEGGGTNFVYYSGYQGQEFMPVLLGATWTWSVR